MTTDDDTTPPIFDTLRDMFGPLDGLRIPGGCDECDAYQTVSPVVSGVWTLAVHHDDWCPIYRHHQARSTP